MEPWNTGTLTELDEETCWGLLDDHDVGRVAWTGEEGPTVVPVNYRLAGRTVEIRTAAYSALARECRDRTVAVEVDRVEQETHTGWSVLVRGRATFHLAESKDGPHPWPAGVRMLRVVVTPASVTGRRLGPAAR